MSAVAAKFPHKLLVPSNLASLPREMTSTARWTCWRPEFRDGKWTKIPTNPRSLQRGSSTDPNTWGTFQEVIASCQRSGQLDLGFVLGDGFCGLDIDGCIGPDGMRPEASGVLRRLDTYSEISVSKTGVHAIFSGQLPAGRRRGPFKGLNVELYDSGRFFVVTADSLGQSQSVNQRTDEAGVIHSEFFGQQQPPSGNVISPFEQSFHWISDDELLERMFASANGTKIRRLWNGSTEDHGGESSAADMALCNALAFWTGRDPQQMDRLFRRCALMRPKWNTKRGETSYGALTIERAQAAAMEIYSPKGPRGSLNDRQPPPASGNSLDNVPEDPSTEHFALSDLGNSERLVRDCLGQVRYCLPLDC